MANADYSRYVRTTHRYDKLEDDQIRILQLLPGNAQDEWSGHFETARLRDRPSYNALLYT